MATMPSVMFDPETRIFSVDLDYGEIFRTVEFDDSHLLDLAADGGVLSIEVLTPDDPKTDQMAAVYGFEDRVPEIQAALDRAIGPHTATAASEPWRPIQGIASVVGGDLAETLPAEARDVFSLLS